MSNIRKIAYLFGIVFLVIGILGFVPTATPGGLLLGIFAVNTTHNVVHLISGLVALYAGYTSDSLSTWYFRVFGIVYALVALMGFMGTDPIFGMANNMADTWLHTVISVVSLYLGFVVCRTCKTA